MRHIDTETMLRRANTLADLAKDVRNDGSEEDKRAIYLLLKEIEGNVSALEFAKELPEPAQLAAAFRIKRAKRKTKRRKAK